MHQHIPSHEYPSGIGINPQIVGAGGAGAVGAIWPEQVKSAHVQQIEEIAKAQIEKLSDPWVHRSSGMRCKTCIWFVPKRRDGGSTSYDVGRCRRHAPTINGYPVVFVNDWCGDHRIDENKV